MMAVITLNEWGVSFRNSECMMVRLPCLWLAACLLVTFTATAYPGEYNEVLSIGDPIPVWKDLPGTDGKLHSLSDLDTSEIVVVVFTCASCPTAVDYEGRIEALTRKYAGQVAVVPIVVNQVAADRLPVLTQRVKDKGFHFHYLYDETQKIAKDFGAIFTPEFYVFNKSRKLVYMGALDDSTDAEGVKLRYVEDAIAAIQSDKAPAVTETIARGCRVRYARERRN